MSAPLALTRYVILALALAGAGCATGAGAASRGAKADSGPARGLVARPLADPFPST